MKFALPLTLLVASAGSSLGESKPATLLPGMGQRRHAISTNNAEAQQFFDQGLALVFAFNHEEAVRSFQRAAAATPYWGIALALGPCINLDVDPAHEKAAYEAAQKAVSLANN